MAMTGRIIVCRRKSPLGRRLARSRCGKDILWQLAWVAGGTRRLRSLIEWKLGT